MSSDPDATIDWYGADVRKGRPVSRIPYKTIAIALAAASLVFALDLSLPLGVAGGVPYVALILIGLWFPKPQHIYALAALASKPRIEISNLPRMAAFLSSIILVVSTRFSAVMANASRTFLLTLSAYIMNVMATNDSTKIRMVKF